MGGSRTNAANPTINPPLARLLKAAHRWWFSRNTTRSSSIGAARIFKLDWLLENNAPVDYPFACDTVYGVVDCAQKGQLHNDGSACIWFALNMLPLRTW